MGSISTSFRLTGASFKLVFQYPAVLLLPVLTLVFVGLWVVLPINWLIWYHENHTGPEIIDFWRNVYFLAAPEWDKGNYSGAVWWYFIQTYVYVWVVWLHIALLFILYFTTVGMHVATTQIRTGKASLAEGFRVATRNLHRIWLMALFTATIFAWIKYLIRGLSRTIPILGRFIRRALMLVLTAVNYLMLPIIIYERAGPFNAFRSAWNNVKKTWAGLLIGTGVVFVGIFVVFEVIVAALVQGALQQDPAVFFTVSTIAAAIIFAISMSVGAAMRAVLYWYATTGEVPAGFQKEDFPQISHHGSITGAPIMVGVAVVPTAPAPAAYASQAPYPAPAYPQQPAYGTPPAYPPPAAYQPPVVMGTPVNSAPASRPKKQTTRLACPQCHTVIVVDFGQKPTCPTCGFGR